MPKMYYCTECERRHKSGKIYKDHMKYKFVEKKEFNSEEIQKVEFPLRGIARRQIANHLAQIKYTGRRGIYTEKINELIEYERGRRRKIKWALT